VRERAHAIEVERQGERFPPGARSRVLVTNDDGIGSPGLQRLATALADRYDVVVAAPSEDVSGCGTGIGRYDAAAPTRLRRTDLDGVEAYALKGPPGLAVMAAALGAFGQLPDLVVSGINAGMNTGTSIIHSGTVGAVLTARTFGIDGLAVSLGAGDRWHWDTAVRVACAAANWVLRQEAPTTLNVNVPGRPPTAPLEARWADIDEFGHFQVATAVEHEGFLDLAVRDREAGRRPGSDTALCRAGHVTLTLLSPLGSAKEPPEPAGAVVDLGGSTTGGGSATRRTG
jgi:5'-nucleotidase